MTEYALRVRFEEKVLLVGNANSVGVAMTWSDRENAKKFAEDNGISHKVYIMPMWYEEDWYSKTVTVKSLQDDE